MPTESDSVVTEISDKDGQQASAASDERLESVRQQGENHSGLADGQYTVSAADTVESLPAQPIPDGVQVAITYDPSNVGVVYVGDGDPGWPLTGVGQGVTLGVTDLSDVSIKANNTGDGVRYLAEVEEVSE